MKQKQKKFDRKISNTAAASTIGIVLLVCLALVWRQQSVVRYVPISENLNNVKKIAPQNSDALEAKSDNTCTPHYYEGDERVHGWGDSQNTPTGDVLMHVTKDDISKMPVSAGAYDTQSGEMQVKIIDPTDVVRGELNHSTPQNPVLITIKGYAEVCSQPPLVSLQPATLAFKKYSTGS